METRILTSVENLGAGACVSSIPIRPSILDLKYVQTSFNMDIYGCRHYTYVFTATRKALLYIYNYTYYNFC